MADTAVLVAGLGPVGGLLAALLGSRGVRTVVVEPHERPYPKPRAAVLDIEAIRVLASLPGMPPLSAWATPLGRNGVVSRGNRPLLLLDLKATAYGLPQIVRIDQPVLEECLRTAIGAMPSVTVMTGRSVVGLSQSAEQVTAVLDDGASLTADWLVGCDGAAGRVRDLAGIAYEGSTFASPWLVVDAEGPADVGVGGRTDGVPTVAFVLDPARPAVAMSHPGHWRWEWMLLPREDPAAMSRPEAVRALIAPWTDPDRVAIRRSAVFTFHARSASRWRVGRVVLAGDAAHLMPPFAGAGLAMGLRDATALAWRLMSPADLETYERERRPDVARTTRLALAIGRVVQTRNPAASAVQRSVIRLLGALPGLQAMAGDRPVPPRRLPGRGGPGFGRVLPNPRVSVAGGPPVRLDEVIGYRWAFIGHGCDPSAAAAGRDGVRLVLDLADPPPGCLPIRDLDGLLAGRPGSVTAARPDRFLLYRSRGLEELDGRLR